MAASPSTGSSWTYSSKANPCPICGRTKDGDCRISRDGQQAICHGARDEKPGTVIAGWAFTGNTSDDRASHWVPDKPKKAARKVVPLRPKAAASPPPAPAPASSPIRLARVLSPLIYEPRSRSEQDSYCYGKDQVVFREPLPGGKKTFRACHYVKNQTKGAGGRDPWPERVPIKGAGPDPWPLYREGEILFAYGKDGSGDWLLEVEGERCAEIARLGRVLATTQPGHAHKVEQIAPRYSRLRAGGVPGVVFLSDNDDEGKRRAEQAAQAAESVGLPFIHLPAAEVWPGIPEKGSIDDAPGTPDDQVAALEAALQRARAQAPAEEQQEQQPLPDAPFRVLGWSVKLDAIWVQTGQTGTVAAIPPTKNGLQRIAPLPFWEAIYPSKLGCNWDAAVSSVCSKAHDLGQTFTPDRIRGRGVWLDNHRVIWHLGNRLEVDGQLQPLTALQDTGWTYGSLPALQIDPTVEALTDTEGAAILDLLHDRMQWDNPGDGLLLAGSIVLGNICGALDIRPGLQITGPSQAGKSTMERTIIRPLQAGLGVRPSGATEAGIRQRMQSDALPVVIDESEQEAAKQREGHLKLLRLSFDGQEQIKGTAGGQALTYTMRSSITLIGINATIPNLADRNRLVVLRPRKLPAAQWAEFMLQRDALVTTDAGACLVRRSVSSLKALLANIKTFQSVVSGVGLADRSAEVYGSLLAGAHHLTSTAVLAPDEALDWLDSKGWDGLDDETTEAIASDVEGRACLDHLLGHAVMWKGSQTGAIDVRELLAIVKGSRPAAAADGSAAKALGRLGVKLDHEGGLVVSRACTVFSGSRWANGAHHDRLLELEGATALSGPVRFAGGPNRRGVCIPLELADL